MHRQSAAWIIEVVAWKRRAPIGENSDEPTFDDALLDLVFGQHQRQILKIFKRQFSLVRALGFATAARFVPVVNLGRS